MCVCGSGVNQISSFKPIPKPAFLICFLTLSWRHLVLVFQFSLLSMWAPRYFYSPPHHHTVDTGLPDDATESSSSVLYIISYIIVISGVFLLCKLQVNSTAFYNDKKGLDHFVLLSLIYILYNNKSGTKWDPVKYSSECFWSMCYPESLIASSEEENVCLNNKKQKKKKHHLAAS